MIEGRLVKRFGNEAENDRFAASVTGGDEPINSALKVVRGIFLTH